jgi:hypothetical protein
MVVNQYISHIATRIKQYLPQIDRVIYLARIDDEGRVLMPKDDNQNEFVYAGLSDIEGNYAYIRHADAGEINYSAATSRQIDSCGSNHRINAAYSLRVVVCLKNWCAYNAEEQIRKALLTVNLSDYSNGTELMRYASVTPTKSTIDSIAVLKDESPNKKKQFDKNLIFVASDFDLQYEINYF